jgi:hypothetical protein
MPANCHPLGDMERRLDNPRRCDVSREVASWRRRVLVRAGFPSQLADELARDGRVDLHDLLELVHRGCAPDLAARILAPL